MIWAIQHIQTGDWLRASNGMPMMFSTKREATAVAARLPNSRDYHIVNVRD